MEGHVHRYGWRQQSVNCENSKELKVIPFCCHVRCGDGSGGVEDGRWEGVSLEREILATVTAHILYGCMKCPEKANL